MVTGAAVITFAFVLSHFFASRSEIYVHEKLKHCSNDFCCNSFIKSGDNELVELSFQEGAFTRFTSSTPLLVPKNGTISIQRALMRLQ